MPVLLGEVVVVHSLYEQQDGSLLMGNIGSAALVGRMAPIGFGPENVQVQQCLCIISSKQIKNHDN